MTPADGIRKFGFRRWYERELIESHLYLVTSFLSLILVLACLEQFSFRAAGIKPFLMLALMIGAAILCAVSLRRYLSMLTRAQQLAEQSVCGRCGSYGRLQVTGLVSTPQEPDAPSLGVQCRQCGYEWNMGSRKPG